MEPRSDTSGQEGSVAQRAGEARQCAPWEAFAPVSIWSVPTFLLLYITCRHFWGVHPGILVCAEAVWWGMGASRQSALMSPGWAPPGWLQEGAWVCARLMEGRGGARRLPRAPAGA